MKWLTYKQKQAIVTTDKHGNPIEKEFLRTKVVKDDEKGRAMAAEEAVGDVIEKDDGKTIVPTDKERLEALEAAVAYLMGMENDVTFLGTMVQLGRIAQDNVPSKYLKDMLKGLEKYR